MLRTNVVVLLRFHASQDFRRRRRHRLHRCPGQIAFLLAVESGVELVEQLRSGAFLHRHDLPRMVRVEGNVEEMKCSFYAGEVVELRDRIAAKESVGGRTNARSTDLLVLN